MERKKGMERICQRQTQFLELGVISRGEKNTCHYFGQPLHHCITEKLLIYRKKKVFLKGGEEVWSIFLSIEMQISKRIMRRNKVYSFHLLRLGFVAAAGGLEDRAIQTEAVQISELRCCYLPHLSAAHPIMKMGFTIFSSGVLFFWPCVYSFQNICVS